jgi:hypothetical protein
VLELARDAATGRQKALEGRVVLLGALEHASHSVRDVIDARAGQALLTQQGDGFMPVAATVFEVRRRTAHLGNETLEQRGNRGARPGMSHRYREAVRMRKRRGTWRAGMVMGIEGQNG